MKRYRLVGLRGASPVGVRPAAHARGRASGVLHESGLSIGWNSRERHRQEHLLRVEKGAVRVQALPYLGVLVVFAVLTFPVAWRGLQPVDGWILLGLYVLYLVQALLRGRKEGEDVEWKKKETWLAVGGVAALALGAYFTVRATENLVSALGLSRTVGGLFITAPMAALPEIFATWSVARSGQITSAVTSVIGDHVVTMTLAFFPLALVTLPVKDMQLFGVTLAFVALVGVLYAAFIHWGGGEHGFKRWQAVALAAVYLAYVAIMLLWVLNVFGQGGRKQQNGSPTSQTTACRALTPPSRPDVDRQLPQAVSRGGIFHLHEGFTAESFVGALRVSVFAVGENAKRAAAPGMRRMRRR